VLVDASDQWLGILAFVQIWRDLFVDVSLPFVVIHDAAGARTRWMLWSEDASLRVKRAFEALKNIYLLHPG
jgi:hypothetical protein